MKQLLRKEFGQLLKELRKAAHMSQEELAEHLDVSRTTIANTESGQNVPKSEFIEKGFQLFRSQDLINKYILIQKDKKELLSLAIKMHGIDKVASVRVLKQAIRESVKCNDLHTLVKSLFQWIIWDLMDKGKTNARKINWVSNSIERLDDLDPSSLLKLLDELYHISKKSKNFDAFMQITDVMKIKMKDDNRRLSQLLYKQSTANYINGHHKKAYKLSSKAIEVMNGEVFQHTAETYHRHSLICMQLAFYEEALEYADACLKITPETSDLYKLVKAGLARMYYMNERYAEAKKIWDDLFKTLGKNDLKRIHSLNDIIMTEIKSGNLNRASEKMRECERLLNLAKNAEWSFYQVEHLLLRRNKAMFAAVKNGNFSDPEVSKVLRELKESYLRDEYELTKNFILERTFLLDTMNTSE
jgi:Predicted transcriptional regulators